MLSVVAPFLYLCLLLGGPKNSLFVMTGRFVVMDIVIGLFALPNTIAIDKKQSLKTFFYLNKMKYKQLKVSLNNQLK